jgi:hypothetical protein
MATVVALGTAIPESAAATESLTGGIHEGQAPRDRRIPERAALRVVNGIGYLTERYSKKPGILDVKSYLLDGASEPGKYMRRRQMLQ